jgi:acetyltransferase-like isoleucine patch superfamily enzyme
MMTNYLHLHYFHLAVGIVGNLFWNILNKLNARWWKVKLGKKCSFYGQTIFRTLPFSSIRIGNECLFNSSHASNLIGVYSPCMISTIARGARIEIGNNCGFSGTVIGSAKHVKLGNNVRCGANTLITDSDWHSDDSRTGEDKPVIIEDNVWLGYGVKVLKGVHIGENSLIGLGSVVTKDIPANVMAAGNPCKIIKEYYAQ